MKRGAPIPDTVTVHVPFRIVKRGGRKEMLVPADRTVQRHADATFVKALARAFRWKQLLDTGQFPTIADLAEREKISTTYLARILRLTLLAPDLVEKSLEGYFGTDLQKAALEAEFPAEWEAQRSLSLAYDSAR
jgi:AraC-like DNA-binding protein